MRVLLTNMEIGPLVKWCCDGITPAQERYRKEFPIQKELRE